MTFEIILNKVPIAQSSESGKRQVELRANWGYKMWLVPGMLMEYVMDYAVIVLDDVLKEVQTEEDKRGGEHEISEKDERGGEDDIGV